MFLKSKSETVDMNDDDYLLELLKFKNHVVSRNEVQVKLDSDVADLSLSEKVKEDSQPTVGPGPSNDASQEELILPLQMMILKMKKNRWINNSL